MEATITIVSALAMGIISLVIMMMAKKAIIKNTAELSAIRKE